MPCPSLLDGDDMGLIKKSYNVLRCEADRYLSLSLSLSIYIYYIYILYKTDKIKNQRKTSWHKIKRSQIFG